MTCVLASKMHNMIALVSLLNLLLCRAAALELIDQRILSTDLDAHAFTSFEINTHRPQADLELVNLTLLEQLHLVVRMERVLAMDAFATVDLPMTCSQDTQWAEVDHQIAVVVLWYRCDIWIRAP